MCIINGGFFFVFGSYWNWVRLLQSGHCGSAFVWRRLLPVDLQGWEIWLFRDSQRFVVFGPTSSPILILIIRSLSPGHLLVSDTHLCLVSYVDGLISMVVILSCSLRNVRDCEKGWVVPTTAS